jgi:hypothetical protein
MATESQHVTGPARIVLFLAVHRQRIARWLLWMCAAGIVLAPVAARVVGGSFGGHGRAVVELVVALLLVSVVLGAWRVAWFVWRNPAPRRHDALFLLVFGAWAAYLACGSLWLIATNLNQVV